MPGTAEICVGREAEVLLEELAHRDELLLEREVREVAGDDDVIDLGARDLARDGAHVRGAMLVRALHAQVHPAREALVEEAVRRHAVERKHVEIGEVCDAHRLNRSHPRVNSRCTS